MGVDLAEHDERAAVTTRLSQLYAGRPVILAFGVLAVATSVATWLRGMGCRVMVVCTTRGAGPLPGGDTVVVEVPAPAAASATEELRTHDRLYRTLPDDAVAAIEAFDPDREALWIGTPFVTSDEPILGRPVTGGRPAAFLALEDKLLAEQVWAAAGVTAAASRVVPVERAALAAASDELASDLGTVWSGDNRGGFNGGGDFVRWVRDERDAAAAFAFFAPRCDQVRVLPFLEGVPCSIHGMVLPDGTAAFRPVEIGVVRDPVRRRFLLGGLSTTWDAPPDDREEMRGVARRVGEHLRGTHGYRGAFGIDGVLTAEGFRPTELNSRMSAGLTAIAEVDRAFFAILQTTLLLGRDPGVSVTELESILPLVDARPVGKPMALLEDLGVGEVDRLPLDWDGERLTRVATEPAPYLVELAHTPSGTFARIEPQTLVAPGARVADATVALLRLLAEELPAAARLGLADYEAAPDVRRLRLLGGLFGADVSGTT
jgi:hypothetical protein